MSCFLNLLQHYVQVIVVGGGLAGLSAVLEALNAGAKVILVDKEANLGGNSAKASSGRLGVKSHTDQELLMSNV